MGKATLDRGQPEKPVRIASYIIALSLILTTASCQSIAAVISPSATPTRIPPTATPTYTPSPPPPTFTPTATDTPIPSATPTATPMASAQQLQVFNELWNAVKENYLYRDFNGLDWDAVYTEYTGRISAGLSDEVFYEAMAEMVASLGDDHSHFMSPEQAAEDDAESAGELSYAGIGAITVPVPERKRTTVLLLFPNSPAEKAGLKIHDSILAVDGQPILDEQGFRHQLLRGPENSQVVLTVQSPGEEPRKVEITRQLVKTDLPVPHFVLDSPDDKRIGYIFLLTFNDRTIPRKFRAALEDLQAGGRLDGLIIDNRFNEGGASDILEDILTYFENGKVGSFVNRDGEEPFQVRGRNFNGTQKVPLVVLIGKDTASFGEIFSGILNDTQRAYLIGEQTDGNVEILYYYGFSDGSRAWLAHDTFQPLNHPDQSWEETGIIPDETVPSNWDEVLAETDPAIISALEYFDKNH